MSQNTGQLSTAIATRNNTAQTPTSISHQLEDWSMKHLPKLASLAGSESEARKIFTICTHVILRSPGLMASTLPSVTNCILQSLELGLYPGPFQECAYVPLKNKTGQKEANFWPMYQGYVKLMLNAGSRNVIARVVREGDYFEFKEGSEAPKFVPSVVLGKKQGERLFCYAAIQHPTGGWHVEVMSPEDVEGIRSRSKAKDSSDSPWNSKHPSDVDAMWAKTVLRRAQKWCAKSPEIVRAWEMDDIISGDSAIKTNLLAVPLGGGETSNVLLAEGETDSEERTENKKETHNER